MIKEKKEKYGIFLGIHDFLWFNLSNNLYYLIKYVVYWLYIY